MKNNKSKDLSIVFKVIENRIEWSRPKQLTLEEMLQSVIDYHKTLDWEYGSAAASVIFSTIKDEDQGTRCSIEYRSGTGNTVIKIYNDGEYKILLPNDDWESYYRIAQTLGYDFFEEGRQIECGCLMNAISFRNQEEHVEEEERKNLNEIYKEKNIKTYMKEVDNRLYKFLQRFNISIGY